MAALAGAAWQRRQTSSWLAAFGIAWLSGSSAINKHAYPLMAMA